MRLPLLLHALTRPDRMFADPALAERLARPLLVPLLLLGLFVPYAAGQRLVTGYYENPYVSTLAAMEVESRIDSLMIGAPPEARARAKERMLRTLLGGQGVVFRTISVLLASLLFLLLATEAWLVHSVLAQFFGGQETRLPGGRRPSLLLFLIAFLPLALRKLIEGVLMAAKNPALAADALSVEEYRRLSRASFSFLDRFLPTGGRPVLPPLVHSLLGILTDPFFLWLLFLLTVGGREVYRVRLRGALAMAALLLALIALQVGLLARLGIRWEI